MIAGSKPGFCSARGASPAATDFSQILLPFLFFTLERETHHHYHLESRVPGRKADPNPRNAAHGILRPCLPYLSQPTLLELFEHLKTGSLILIRLPVG